MSPDTDLMNCEDYKLAQTADPAFNGGAEHLASCAECCAYRDELEALNARIVRALEITVPELIIPELPDIDSGNIAVLTPRRTIPKPAWFAIAASVLLATFLGISFTGVGTPQSSVATQLLAHMDHEPFAFRSTKAVSDKRLSRIVPANIATMNHNAGLITYAQSCIINGKNIPHLVVQGERGPITILLMPDEDIGETELINGESIHGFIFPINGGSVAIIGEKEEELDFVKRNVMESVTWGT